MELPKIMRISSDRSIRPLKIPAPVPRLPRPCSTITDSALIFNSRRRLLTLHFEEVEDTHFIKFPSTTSRPLMSPEKDTLVRQPLACTGATSESMEPRNNLGLIDSPSSQFLQLLQIRQLQISESSLKEGKTQEMYNSCDRWSELGNLSQGQTGSESLSQEMLESFLLNATAFNPEDKMNITQRKIIDKQPDRAKQLLKLPLQCWGRVPSAFGLIMHNEEDESKNQMYDSEPKQQDQTLSLMSTLNRVCQDTRRSPRRSFLQDYESLILPIQGISSTYMSSQEMRFISRKALFFLHFYTNTFKRVTIDSVLRQNSKLDAKLYEISKTLDNDKLMRILSNRPSPTNKIAPIIKQTVRDNMVFEECDLDRQLLLDQDQGEYGPEYYQKLERTAGQLKLEIFVESPDKQKRRLLSCTGKSEYASVTFSDSLPQNENSKILIDSFTSEQGSAISPTFGGISQQSSPSLKESSQITTQYNRGLNRLYNHIDQDRSDSPQLYRENTDRLMHEIQNYISNNKDNLIIEEALQEEKEEDELSWVDSCSAFTYEPYCSGIERPDVARNCSFKSVNKPKKRASSFDFKLQLLPSQHMPKRQDPSVIFGNSPGEQGLEMEMEEIILGYTKKLREQLEKE